MGWEPQQVGPNLFLLENTVNSCAGCSVAGFFGRSQKEILRTSMGMPFADNTMPFTF